MPWISTNLAAAMPGITDKANAAIKQVSDGVKKLEKQVGAMLDTKASALDALTVSKGDLAKITAAGFYMITLAPKKGAWDSRLSAAMGEPPNKGYCCGTANIILSADPAAALDSFNKAKDMMMKPVDDVKAFIDDADFTDFEPEEVDEDLLEELDIKQFKAPDWDTLFESDKWKSASLGDVFGGAMEGVAGYTNKLAGDSKSILNSLNGTKKITAGLNKGLSAATKLVNDLGKTGTYNIILEPGPRGGYLQRLKSEAGAPPSEATMYSAGFVCITIEPDISALTGKFDTLQKLATGGKK